MAKKYRVKHYYSKDMGARKAKPHPVAIVLLVVLLGGLAFLGTIIYKPVRDFVMDIGSQSERIETPEPSLSPESTPVSEDEPEPESAFEPQLGEMQGPMLPSEDEPEPEDEPEAVYAPETFKTIYMPYDTASNDASLDAFIESLSGTDINTVLVDIKDQSGEVLFKSGNEQVSQWGTVAQNAIDLNALVSKLESKNLYLAARLTTFRDSAAATAGKDEYAITVSGGAGAVWRDSNGNAWLNPYSEKARQYIKSLAEEAIDSGAKMVVLESLRFPDNSLEGVSFTPDGAEPQMTRSDALKAMLAEISDSASAKQAKTAVYYTTLEFCQPDIEQIRYGGSPSNIAGEMLLLDVRPALFGGDFSGGGINIVNPLGNPAGTVKESIDFVKRLLSPDTRLIPFIQGGNVERFNFEKQYTHQQIDEQISQVEESGYKDYSLYCVDGVYLLK